MASSTVEDYLKHLFLQQQKQQPGQLVPTGKVAESLGVTPGTATVMVKALAESGLVDYEPRQGVRLTEKGQRLALHVLRRHRLVELFLVEILGLDWSEVRDEAEVLEHAVSDKVLDRIDEILGHPEVDPHGDQIPSSDGRFPARELQSLTDCQPGQIVKIARVNDDDARFLRFAEDRGLTPGIEIFIEDRDPVADSVTIRPQGRDAMVVGTSAARQIFVTLAVQSVNAANGG